MLPALPADTTNEVSDWTTPIPTMSQLRSIIQREICRLHNIAYPEGTGETLSFG
jgi:hypothetical protein